MCASPPLEGTTPTRQDRRFPNRAAHNSKDKLVQVDLCWFISTDEYVTPVLDHQLASLPDPLDLPGGVQGSWRGVVALIQTAIRMQPGHVVNRSTVCQKLAVGDD